MDRPEVRIRLKAETMARVKSMAAKTGETVAGYTRRALHMLLLADEELLREEADK